MTLHFVGMSGIPGSPSTIDGKLYDYLHPMDQDVSDPGEILKTTEYTFFEAPLLIDSF